MLIQFFEMSRFTNLFDVKLFRKWENYEIIFQSYEASSTDLFAANFKFKYILFWR